ncbi:hypothetical protein [Cellulomonas algicola]|uniref:hypothetical protein n=1 Tax=Cellulomonas algicola TaxID=2071633 RepID=UPI0027D9C719|nr:hypothetical protein [Cellulomonas algicola]
MVDVDEVVLGALVDALPEEEPDVDDDEGEPDDEGDEEDVVDEDVDPDERASLR